MSITQTAIMYICQYTTLYPCSTDDYTAVSEVLIFNSDSDSLSQNVMVMALPDTVSGEGDEVFFLSLTGYDPAVLPMVFTANVTITDASKHGLL